MAKKYSWELVTDSAPFAPRDGAGALVFQNKMWLIGGWNPTNLEQFPRICNNEIWSSDNGKDWELVKPNSFIDKHFDSTRDWEGRHTAGYVVHKDAMWIVGGDVNQGHYHSDVWFSNNGSEWVLANPNLPVPWGPRALHYTVCFKDAIWVMGGQTIPQLATAPQHYYSDTWQSSDGKNWTKVLGKDPKWAARGMIGGQAIWKDRIWLIGGGRYDTPTSPGRVFYSDVWSTSDGVNWKLHTPAAPWDPRQYHEVAVFDDRLWVLEGWSGQNRSDVWFSDNGEHWQELQTPWAPRHAASIYVHQDSLWVVGGNNMASDVWRLKQN